MQTHRKICSIIPKSMKNDERIQRAMVDAHSTSCQFDDSLPADYSYENEDFCILHLPFSEKESKKLFTDANEAFDILVKNKTNYNFIHACGLKITNNQNSKNNLSFVGSYLWSFTIDSQQFDTLNLYHTTICGNNIITACKIEQLLIKNTDVSADLLISGTNIKFLHISDKTKLHSGGYGIRQDYYNHGIRLPNSKINDFKIINCECELTLAFDDAEINSLDLSGTKFYLVPSFFNIDFSDENKRIVLPKRKLFIIKNLIKLYKFFNFNNLHNRFWHLLKSPIQSINEYRRSQKILNETALTEYRKLREIYNITKERGMFIEQGDIFI